MHMNKRILSLTLALVMILGTFTAVFAEVTTVEQKAAEFLRDNGVLEGDEKGDLLLDKKLERRDAVVLSARLLGEEEKAANTKFDEKTPSWTDVRTDKFYVPFFAWAETTGRFEGKGEGIFEPRAGLTTQEYATVLLRILGHELNGKDAWKTVMELAKKEGLLENVDAKADDILMRGNMAVMTLNALGATVKGTGKTLADELNIKLPVPAKLAVEDVYADNLKEVKVVLNKEANKEVLDKDLYTINNNIKVKDVFTEGNTLVLSLENDSELKNNRTYKLEIKGTKEINGKHDFKVFDNQAPEVVEVVGLGSRAVKVVMSEPIKTNPRIRDFKIDGKDINGTAEVVGREIFIKTYRDIEAGDHELLVPQLADYNNFKSSSNTYTFEIVEDKDAPVVVEYKATTNKLVIEFNEDVDKATVNNKSAYWMLGKTKKYSNGTPKALAGNKYEFSFTNDDNELPLRDTVIYLDGIADYSRNKMSEYELTVNAELDKEEPTIISVEATEKDTIVVRYNKEVETGKDDKNSAVNKKNYEVKDEKGNKVGIYSIDSVEGSKSKFKIVLDKNLKSDTTYVLSVSGVKDLNRYPNYLFAQDIEFTLEGKTVAPEAKLAIFSEKDGVQKIQIFFSKDMDLNTISNPENYLVKFNGKIRDLSDFAPYMYNKNSKEVVIEVSVDDLAKDLDKNSTTERILEIIGTDLKDTEGNRIKNYGQEIEKDKGTAITLSNKLINVTNKEKFEIEFTGKVDTVKDDAVKVLINNVNYVKNLKKDDNKVIVELKKDFPVDKAMEVNILFAEDAIKGLNGKSFVPVSDAKLVDKIAPEVDKINASIENNKLNLDVIFTELVTTEGIRSEEVQLFVQDKDESNPIFISNIGNKFTNSAEGTKEFKLANLDLGLNVKPGKEYRVILKFVGTGIKDIGGNPIVKVDAKSEEFITIKSEDVKFDDSINTNNLRFMVKGLKDGDVEKVATAQEVISHFKSGLTLDVKVEDGKLVLGNTSMTSELWNELKSLDGADRSVPYRITILSGDSKDNKVAKIAFYQDGTAVLESIIK